SHNITAVYSGDSNFLTSQSGVEQTTVPTVLATGLSVPLALAVNSQGDVFIADIGNHQVLEVKPGGKQLPVGSGLLEPVFVAVNGQDDLFVVDANTGVWKLTPPDYSSQLPYSGPLRGNPAVAFDSQGDQFIADTNNNQVLEYKVDGTQITVGS